MEITNMPTPTLPEWVKLYNTYDPEHYAPGKRVSAEEWNTLFLASVRQGNYNADTLELLIDTYLPETYQTIANFDKFAAMLRTDFAEVQTTVEAFTARVEKAEDVAYSLDATIQDANRYAKQAYMFSEEANATAQNALGIAESTVAVADSAAAVSTSANSTSQTALSNSQTAINTANKADIQSTQALTAANSASLRSEDAIATANAAKLESFSAKNTADTAIGTAENATTISEEARTLAQNALDQVTQGLGTRVTVAGELVNTFNADTKADLSYVDQKVADLVGSAPDTLDTLDELAGALKDNADIVTVLENAIAKKANTADIAPTIQFAETERQKSKNLVDINTDILYFAGANISQVVGEKISLTTSSNQAVAIIPVKPNTTYFLNMSGLQIYPVLVGKDKETQTQVFAGWGYGTLTFTTNANSYYLVGVIKDQTDASLVITSTLLVERMMQLEEGTVATEYQPYNGAITHNNDAPIVFAESERQKSKNLFDISRLVFGEYAAATIDYTTGIITFNQNANSTGSTPIKQFADVQVGKSYTLSFKTTGPKDYIYLNGSKINWYNGTSHVFTQAELDAGVHMYGENDATTTMSEIQIELGETATSYQLYNGSIVREKRLSEYLPLSGGTMRGTIVDPVFRHNVMDQYTAPSTTQWRVTDWFYDKNNKAIAVRHLAHQADGSIEQQLDIRRDINNDGTTSYSAFTIGMKSNGAKYSRTQDLYIGGTEAYHGYWTSKATGRLASLNFAHESWSSSNSGQPLVRMDLATGSCKEGKPAADGYVMTFMWDNTGTYDSQLFISNGSTDPQIRSNTGNGWGAWRNIAMEDKLLNKIYPVGSVYLSTTQTSPASFLGGTWTAIGAGYALWTTTTANDGGNTIAAGLPQIGGSFETKGFAHTPTGGFSTFTVKESGAPSMGSANWLSRVSFWASDYSSVYKTSVSTVQPPAYKVYAWKRTA